MSIGQSSQAVAALADEVWEALLAREPYFAAREGRRIDQLPSGGLADVEAAARDASVRLARLNAIDVRGLNKTERLTVASLAHTLQVEVEESERWWTGFGVTPYSSAVFSMLPPLVFCGFTFDGVGEYDRYLSLVRDFAKLIEAQRERLLLQAERGWRVPKAALPGARNTLERIAASLPLMLVPDSTRLGNTILRDRVERMVTDEVGAAFRALIAELSAEYEALAPDAVGLSNHPGGDKAYRRWVRFHLTEAGEPEEIHRIGLDEVGRLAAQMEEVRRNDFGWNGDEADFHLRLRADPRAKAASPEALEATYRRHLQRMQDIFPNWVGCAPRSHPNIKRLAPELEAGMTFGYYDPGAKLGDPGYYYYSGFGLEDRLQLNAAPLIFHELVPGHHVHLSLQAENKALPEIRRKTFSLSAFNEGWAEYSAGIGEEAGLYDDPYDLYGWLSHQRFVAQRLVVDTGLNALGWSLERARSYMSANTLEGPTQVASETLRYATDLPGQALAYRMGFLRFRSIREKARTTMRDRFRLPGFHQAVLSEGALPLGVLADSIEEWASEAADAHG